MTSKPIKPAGMVKLQSSTRPTSVPFAIGWPAIKATIETQATDTGEQITPI